MTDLLLAIILDLITALYNLLLAYTTLNRLPY